MIPNPLPYTVAAQSVANVVSIATPRVAPRRLLETVGFGPATLNGRTRRVPYSQLVALYREAARLAGDDAFGLHVGEHTELRAFGLLGHLVLNCPNLGEAIHTVARYLPLWTDGASLGIDMDRTAVRLVWDYTDASMADCRHDCEMSLATLSRIGQMLSTVAGRPREVHFRHRAPRNISEHRRVFGSKVHFDMPSDELILERDHFDIPVQAADRELHQLLKTHLDGLLAQVRCQGTYSERARSSIHRTLPLEVPTLETVSRDMGVSARTLQRRLLEEGTSHGRLLDEVRRESAERYLRDGQVPIREIADRLRFSESSAFHRAYRRWQGVAPGTHRRQMA